MQTPRTFHNRSLAAFVVCIAVFPPAEVSSQAVTSRVLTRKQIGQVLQLTPAQLRALQVVARDSVATVPDTAKQVTLRAGQFIVVARTAPPQPHPNGASAHVDLPYELVGLTASNAAVHLRVRLEVAGGGLRYEPSDGVFRGDVLIGLENTVDPGASEQLSGPIQLQITGADTVRPGDITLSHTNLPYDSVRLVATTTQDRLDVHVHPTFDPGGVDVPVPVRQPAILPGLSPRRIDGLGLEAATVTLLGTARVPAESLAVTLAADRGQLGSTSLLVARNRAATTTVRSRGFGRDRLMLTSSLSDPMAISVTYAIPIAFAIAALAGGLIGALLTHLKARRARRDSSGSRHFAAGVLSGVVAAVAYGFGVNLLGVAVTIPYGSEGAAFLIAFLAGYYGLPKLGSKVTAVGRFLSGPSA